ncbi:hypothetical protein L1D52_17930 [Vibrio brasiliensis]|uniref:hypothetical protein n=1 Tax=Vibrio brasiliensis TaxID=170652 RepID=UPI001EFD840C|nr:hypothetical protein [Vibrio brasiliensis]MCG9784234.1 hypothetical protein [Vibrio brasiliensis]
MKNLLITRLFGRRLNSEKREARSEKREARSEKREARSEKREARSEKREARKSWKVDVKASTFFLDFRRKSLTKNSVSDTYSASITCASRRAQPVLNSRRAKPDLGAKRSSPNPVTLPL